MKPWFPLLIFGMTLVGLKADDFQKAKFTEVIRDVRVTTPDVKEIREAKVNDIFELPQVIRTGMDSRAELEAPDKTIARVGANTIFSFEAAKRTMNLQSGSVLFHSPKGMGGGTIRTAAATAAVTGTTIMVGATSNGGFKIMVLEGKSRVTHPSGDSKVLVAGQMTFIIPGKNVLGPTINFDLQRATQNSSLLNGFKSDVSSKEKIDEAVNQQQKEIKTGRSKETQVEILDVKNSGPVVLDLPRQPEPEVRGGAGGITSNSFSELLSYLNSQTANLNLTTATLNNVFTSNIPASGTYKGFTQSITGSYAALGGEKIDFYNVNYDLSSYKDLTSFGFVAGGSMGFNTSLGTMEFSNSPDKVKFLATGGTLTFSGTSSIIFFAKEISFESLGNISNGTESTFIKSTGIFDKLEMTSKNGTITLNNPTFNSKVTRLTADTVNLDNLAMSQFASGGPKALYVYTTKGGWYYDNSALPTQSGNLNIRGSVAGTASNASGGQVVIFTTPYEIYSGKK